MSSNPSSARWRISWVALLKVFVASLMAFFIYRAILKAQAEFADNDFTLSQIRWPWLLLAGVSYVLGMLPMGANWHRLLRAMQQDVPLWSAVKTHFISQLGKYVPGKACVPAIRFALLARYKLNIPTTFVSMLAETLSMMSVGAVVGGVIVAVVFRDKPMVAVAAAGFGGCSRCTDYAARAATCRSLLRNAEGGEDW